MESKFGELARWCERQREESLRQIEMFGTGGTRAILQMPDGSTMDITSSVVDHQIENVMVFARLAAALS